MNVSQTQSLCPYHSQSPRRGLVYCETVEKSSEVAATLRGPRSVHVGAMEWPYLACEVGGYYDE